jgi:hypothetical protein
MLFRVSSLRYGLASAKPPATWPYTSDSTSAAGRDGPKEARFSSNPRRMPRSVLAKSRATMGTTCSQDGERRGGLVCRRQGKADIDGHRIRSGYRDGIQMDSKT